MKRTTVLAILAAVSVPFLAFGQSEEYYDRSYTRLSFVQGDVYIQRAQDLGYEQGEVNLVVVAGDKLGTRDGRAEIQLGRGNILRLDRDTRIDVAGLPGRDGEPVRIHILAGNVFIRVRQADREKDLQIHTPDASFYVLEPGLYRLDVRDDERTEFTSYSGRAEAAGEEGSLEVESGEAVTAWDGRLRGESSPLYARNDDFASWNRSRDDLYAKRLEKTYLPSEYADYEYELAEHGDWAYEADYGYVWVPRVHYPEWRPYYHGRWSWYPVIGWTWISAEPWGWCTSHYGRWGWRFGLGWYWIPTHHWGWGPAWVNWYHHYDYIGWSPLSYWGYPCWIHNNRFYGRDHRGWYGDFRDHARTMTIVRRDQLQDRRISRVALDGRSGIKLERTSLQARQPDLRPVIGRNAELESRARRTLDRGSLRGVERSFGSAAGRLTSPRLQERSKDVRKLNPSADGKAGSARRVQERVLRPQTEPRSSGVVKRGADRSLEQSPARKSSPASAGSLAGAAKRSFSSSRERREISSKPASGSGSASPDRSGRAIRNTDGTDRGSTPRSDSRFPLISRAPRASSDDSSPTIRYYSRSSRLAAPTAGSSPRSSSSYRTWGSPTENRTRFENRAYTPSSRSVGSSRPAGSSSRPYLSPRSYGSSSKISLSPSRSSRSSSRSYSTSPRRSSSSRSSARSVGSSPSRSSSGSSRSSSSPSRSSSSSSRSSSGSRSSGSVHRR